MAAEPEISDDGLKFIRDEILKVMVAKIAASREEIAGDVVAANAQTQSAGALQFAVSNLTAVQIGCAVVCALYERGAIDPARVVAWAEWLADNQPLSATAPAVTGAVANTLRNFAKVLGSMTAPRPAGPSARN